MATHLHTVQVIVLFLLFLVAVFAAVAQRIQIPYPILLTLAGLAIAFVPHVPRIPLQPDLVFLIFLRRCCCSTNALAHLFFLLINLLLN